jgi:RNase P/RNase MRP subunit p30
MISTNNIEQAKNLIKKSKKKSLIVLAQNDEFNRKVLEYGHFDILLGVEKGERKRGLRQIDSGFNEVLAHIAAKNKVALGINMEELRNLEKEEKAKRLERISQNIKLCRKSGVKIKLLNIKDEKGAFAFLLSLGASTAQAKEATSLSF